MHLEFGDAAADVRGVAGDAQQLLRVPTQPGLLLLYSGDVTHQASRLAWSPPVVTPPAPPPLVPPVVTPAPRSTSVSVVFTSKKHTKVVLVLSGSVAAAGGRLVVVQVKRHGRWVTLGKVRLNAKGHGTLVLRGLAAGRVTLRLSVAATATTRPFVRTVTVTLR